MGNAEGVCHFDAVPVEIVVKEIGPHLDPASRYCLTRTSRRLRGAFPTIDRASLLRHGAEAHVKRWRRWLPDGWFFPSDIGDIGANRELTDLATIFDLCGFARVKVVDVTKKAFPLLAAFAAACRLDLVTEWGDQPSATQFLEAIRHACKERNKDAVVLFSACLGLDDFECPPLLLRPIVALAWDPAWIPIWLQGVGCLKGAHRAIELGAKIPKVNKAINGYVNLRGNYGILDTAKLSPWGFAVFQIWRNAAGLPLDRLARPHLYTVFEEIPDLDQLRTWCEMVGPGVYKPSEVFGEVWASTRKNFRISPNFGALLRFCREHMGLDYDKIPFLEILHEVLWQRDRWPVWLAHLRSLPEPRSARTQRLLEICEAIEAD